MNKLIAIASAASVLLISCSADTTSTSAPQGGANDFQTLAPILLQTGNSRSLVYVAWPRQSKRHRK